MAAYVDQPDIALGVDFDPVGRDVVGFLERLDEAPVLVDLDDRVRPPVVDPDVVADVNRNAWALAQIPPFRQLRSILDQLMWQLRDLGPVRGPSGGSQHKDEVGNTKRHGQERTLRLRCSQRAIAATNPVNVPRPDWRFLHPANDPANSGPVSMSMSM